jgi:hypothetical protein
VFCIEAIYGNMTRVGLAVAAGWGGVTALLAGGDFSGDGNADVLARQADGTLSCTAATARAHGSPAAGRRSAPAGRRCAGSRSPPVAPAAAGSSRPRPAERPVPDGRVRLNAGIRCVPPGDRLRVSLRVRPRPGRPAPRVLRVVFFSRGGERRVDRRRPYVVRLAVTRPAGERGRVFARVVYRRAGSKRVRRKTVSGRFVMCR